jgi:hypothetical protein
LLLSLLLHHLLLLLLLQAARDIAGTIAHSANRVFLNAESLLLNLGDTKPQATGANK